MPAKTARVYLISHVAKHPVREAGRDAAQDEVIAHSLDEAKDAFTEKHPDRVITTTGVKGQS